MQKIKRRSEKLRNDPHAAQAAEYGWSLLQLAAYSGHLEVVKWLVEEHGADVSMESRDGYTPLMCAAKNGHKEPHSRWRGQHGHQHCHQHCG